MDKLMTTGEVAKRLGITPQQVWTYCRRGDLGRLIAGRYLVSERELARFRRPGVGRKKKRK
jgi:predicted ArsR family transcriptional regulator